jgi:choline kinase
MLGWDNIMRGIILAAGRGSRMGSLTECTPKYLIQFVGKSLLQWQLEALRGAGISEIAIVRGFMSHMLNEPGIEYFENHRWAETNMVMSLICAKEWLKKGECVVSYADIIYPAETILKLMKKAGDIVITYDSQWLRLWKARFEDPLTDAETFMIDKKGILTDIGRKPKTIKEIHGQYMGLLKFTPEGWNRIEIFLSKMTIEKKNGLDMTSLFRGLLNLNVGTTIKTVSINNWWLEIDSENDLKIYNR